MTDVATQKIRELNDQLRRDMPGDAAVITPGVAALGQEAVARIVRTIQVFDDFNCGNDPWEEHDSGCFPVGGNLIFFKIDYFDLDLKMHSPDASDPAVTRRVLTIMLADEY